MKTDMRVAVTNRMLREGMIRCMAAKPLSKITVSDLCRESGINRTTFYNHYETPPAILRDISIEYADKLLEIYHSFTKKRKDDNDDEALEACLAYLSERKAEIKVLFSPNAENYLAGACMEIIDEKVAERAVSANTKGNGEEDLLRLAAAAAAVYGFIQIWILMDIDRTPKELVTILKKSVRGRVFA